MEVSDNSHEAFRQPPHLFQNIKEQIFFIQYLKGTGVVRSRIWWCPYRLPCHAFIPGASLRPNSVHLRVVFRHLPKLTCRNCSDRPLAVKSAVVPRWMSHEPCLNLYRERPPWLHGDAVTHWKTKGQLRSTTPRLCGSLAESPKPIQSGTPIPQRTVQQNVSAFPAWLTSEHNPRHGVSSDTHTYPENSEPLHQRHVPSEFPRTTADARSDQSGSLGRETQSSCSLPVWGETYSGPSSDAVWTETSQHSKGSRGQEYSRNVRTRALATIHQPNDAYNPLR